MKKTIGIMCILLVGLMVLGGCTSTTIEPSTNQEQNQQNINAEPEQNQQQAVDEEILTPPALPKE